MHFFYSIPKLAVKEGKSLIKVDILMLCLSHLLD